MSKKQKEPNYKGFINKKQKEPSYTIPPQTVFEKKLQTFCRWFIGGVYGLSFGIIFYSIVDGLIKRII